MSVKVSRANSLYGYPSPQSNQFLDPKAKNSSWKDHFFSNWIFYCRN